MFVIVFFDLNLFGMDGCDFLLKLKIFEKMKYLFVVVMISLDVRQDIDYCYQVGVNSYVVKLVVLDGFMVLIRCLCEYWFKVVMLLVVK